VQPRFERSNHEFVGPYRRCLCLIEDFRSRFFVDDESARNIAHAAAANSATSTTVPARESSIRLSLPPESRTNTSCEPKAITADITSRNPDIDLAFGFSVDLRRSGSIFPPR
jgi:hypothetical protein